VPADVIEAVLAFHDRRRSQPAPGPVPAEGYRAESLRVLFGGEGQ